MKLSVILPGYNSEAYLEKCLDSLVNQTYSDLEIIIINDGSKDNSEAIIISYQSSNSNIIYLKQPQSGVSIARNTGIEVASGEYIAFIDSDDWVDLDTYERMISA